MSNLQEKIKEYNEIPVFYCKKCLSLRIRHILSMNNSEYCDECGSTYIEQTSIENWEELFKDKYGHTPLETY